jgi:hypothetical protein
MIFSDFKLQNHYFKFRKPTNLFKKKSFQKLAKYKSSVTMIRTRSPGDSDPQRYLWATSADENWYEF